MRRTYLNLSDNINSLHVLWECVCGAHAAPKCVAHVNVCHGGMITAGNFHSWEMSNFTYVNIHLCGLPQSWVERNAYATPYSFKLETRTE